MNAPFTTLTVEQSKTLHQIDYLFDSLIFKILKFILIIDSLTGFLIQKGIYFSPSQIIKIILIGLLIFRLVRSGRGLILVLSIFLYLSVMLVHWSFNIDIEAISDTVNLLYKFIIVILLYSWIRMQQRININNYSTKIWNVLYFNFYVLTLSVILGPLGFGYQQYDNSIGFRGFFFAGNELAGVSLALFPIILFNEALKNGLKSKRFIYYAIVAILAALLMATKASILGIFLTLIFLPSLLPEKKSISVSLSRIIQWIFKLMLLLIIIYFSYTLLDSIGIINRWSYYFERDGILSLISGRDSYLSTKIIEFRGSNLMCHILGLGENRTVEMDPVDVLLNYGYIGVIITYGFYSYLIINCIRCHRNLLNIYAKSTLFINMLLLLGGSLSGHIIFSGMAGVFIAIINGFPYLKST